MELYFKQSVKKLHGDCTNGQKICYNVSSKIRRQIGEDVLPPADRTTHIEPDVLRERNPSYEMPILPIFRKQGN